MLISPSGYWESQGEKGEKKEINNTTLTMQESLEMLRGDGDANPTVRFGRIDELLRRHRRRGDTGRRGDNFRPLDDLSSTIGKPSVNLKGSPILWVCSVLVSLCVYSPLSLLPPACPLRLDTIWWSSSIDGYCVCARNSLSLFPLSEGGLRKV